VQCRFRLISLKNPKIENSENILNEFGYFKSFSDLLKNSFLIDNSIYAFRFAEDNSDFEELYNSDEFGIDEIPRINKLYLINPKDAVFYRESVFLSLFGFILFGI